MIQRRHTRKRQKEEGDYKGCRIHQEEARHESTKSESVAAVVSQWPVTHNTQTAAHTQWKSGKV
jgi:hypothetical protein